MSVFSDMLRNYIHEKDVKVGALAHYCNLERSTVYKFINGKREPLSAELVEQIAYFIKLTPLETHQLRETWKITRMGEDAYYIRKSIDHFLCDFPNKSTPPSYDFTPPHTLKFNQTTVFHSELSSAEFQAGSGFFCSPYLTFRSIKKGRPDFSFSAARLSFLAPFIIYHSTCRHPANRSYFQSEPYGTIYRSP